MVPIERPFIATGITPKEDRARIGDLPHGRGLLGLIIRENRTYRIPSIANHLERYGFPPNHPEMQSFLGMPITIGDATVGRLYLTNKLEAVEFSEDDQALVEMFALHAGIAIENARLHDQVGRLAIVDERDRISRDLHDSVIQAIYAQTLALDDVPELVGEISPEAGQARRRRDRRAACRHPRHPQLHLRPAPAAPRVREACSTGSGPWRTSCAAMQERRSRSCRRGAPAGISGGVWPSCWR